MFERTYVDEWALDTSYLLSCAKGNGGVGLCVPQCGAANAEIKVPSGENTELKRSPFKA